MPFSVQASREDPAVDVLVDDAVTGARKRLTILSGVVAVIPPPAPGMRMYVRGQQPGGEPCGLYVPGGPVLPPDGDVTVHAEVSLAQVVVNARVDNVDVVYGIGDVAVQLVTAPDRPGRWVFLTFMCYGVQPMAVRYRVTLQRAA